MTRSTRAISWLLIGGWLLMTPPTPLRTSLPPLSEWSKVSTHKTADECERKREAMHSAARRTVSSDAKAHALEVAAALGRLQSRCIESKDPTSAATEAAANAPAANPPIANPPVANQPPAAAEPQPATEKAGAPE